MLITNLTNVANMASLTILTQSTIIFLNLDELFWCLNLPNDDYGLVRRSLILARGLFWESRC